MAAPASVLDVGCGEGVLTDEWAERLDDGRIVGIDLDDPKLRAEWEMRRRPNLEFRAEEATRCPSRDDEFDLATAIEVLEHVPEPEATLAEMARVARGSCWCRCRASRCGAGSTWPAAPTARPRQHARAREPLVEARVRVAALALRQGRAGALALPVDDAACPRGLECRRRWRPVAAPARRGYGRGASSRSGIGVTGAHHIRLLLARQPRAVRGRVRRGTLLWSAIFITVSVLYRAGGAAAVPDDRRPRRARRRRQRRLRVAATIQLALGLAVRGRWRSRCAARSQDDLFDGSPPSTGS